MKKHTLKDWFIATRPWSFVVSAMPVLLTFLFLAFRDGGFAGLNVLNFVLALVGILIFHAAGNVLSDWFDYRSGVDSKDAYAVPNLVLGYYQPKEYLMFGSVLLAIGCVVGVLLTVLSGPMLLVIGIAGLLLTVAYSYCKGKALGEVVIFLNFGVLPMLGTSFVTTGSVDFSTLLLSLPIGFITVAVLLINNIRDMATDRAAGLKTLPMLLNASRSVKLYQAIVIIPFCYIALMAVLGYLPWFSLLALLGFLPARDLLTGARQFEVQGNEAILTLDQKTAKLQLIFGLTFAIGLLVAAIL